MTPTTMTDLVETSIEDDCWQACDLNTLAQVFCAATLSHLGYPAADFEISLLGCNDTRISELNDQFRGKGLPTNVLSWPSADRASQVPGGMPGPLPPTVRDRKELGDIAIAFGVCAQEARIAGKPLDQHVAHLLVHSTLHLLGYDHIDVLDARLMEDIERKVLATLGQPDPYGEDQEI